MLVNFYFVMCVCVCIVPIRWSFLWWAKLKISLNAPFFPNICVYLWFSVFSQQVSTRLIQFTVTNKCEKNKIEICFTSHPKTNGLFFFSLCSCLFVVFFFWSVGRSFVKNQAFAAFVDDSLSTFFTEFFFWFTSSYSQLWMNKAKYFIILHTLGCGIRGTRKWYYSYL